MGCSDSLRFIVLVRGIEDQMRTAIHSQKQVLRWFPLVAAICLLLITGHIAAKAQDAPSIIGSSPLGSLTGATDWINSKPLTAKDLKGKVVLVDFWAYSCINCIRAIPYVRAWAEKYRDHGLVVIGVHAPEFAFERNVDNVKKAIATLKIGYPVAIDNDYKIWRSFENEDWPGHFFRDGQRKGPHHHFGEGNYDESEQVIQKLLAEAGDKDVPAGTVA